MSVEDIDIEDMSGPGLERAEPDDNAQRYSIYGLLKIAESYGRVAVTVTR
jgi:hypothetical protein